MERRLTAIFAADVVGYSRLMGEDEVGTLERLKACRRELIDPSIARHHGRMIKLMGDGALVEFGSVVDAVQCAADIQRKMAERDKGIADDRLIRFRIGVNLGDIIVEGEDIYGDGVNIAARLEAQAEPGGVCISGTAFDHAVHKCDVGFASLGEQRLKNIADPVRVYRILLEPSKAGKVLSGPRRPLRPAILATGAALLVAAAVAGTVIAWQWLRAPQRPSVAVLPFSNLSGDPAQDYLAEGITEDLITDLAKLSGLDVIAGNSVAAYKGKPPNLADVRRELGVDFLVEGSVRPTGELIRINAQLIDTANGEHVWADRFDRRAAETFAVQDEMRKEIVAALDVEPSAMETKRMERPPTANLEAYDYYLRGEHAAFTGRPPGMRDALNFYAKAVALDPSFAAAFAADARTAVYVWRNAYDDVLQSAPARKRAYESAGRALQLNPDLSLPYAMLAILQSVDRRFDEAIESARRAVALGPGDVEAQVALGYVCLFDGKFPEAAAAVETALRLDPDMSPINRQIASTVFLFNGDGKRAVAALERARDEAPGVGNILVSLGAAYAQTGRIADARAAVAQGLRLLPNNDSIAAIRMGWHFRNPQDLETLIGTLKQAGLPEWPYAFKGDESDRLKGEDISALVIGHTLKGVAEPGPRPAIMQIGNDGQAAFRSTAQFITETISVKEDLLCEQSENAFGRPDCGPIYRRQGEFAFSFVNSRVVFHFSPLD
ncbi:adenylate/guanylate cyclase domain-containing protein [Mesorhizobium sp. M4B.F.Ca.ET.143.01.1.1]|uniref:adenylate/guanylate cyclase domain-containing protein n=1 Tax=Mesorhizobium sp. M4B.F.Ca.ET.143.01.1.1 TaxID=2563947 RepID=UPI001093A22D|nr:adenylate/guanylate cyclase domain-containing protein [Mesorhizobium sp. M4B.F.Ca.ET.143.01.1.1]TGV22275.1 adenylate/guanylate cyclase domain-containing protein [Mesorhizobium sp. M4B.F.Ca.ET.143.01.1.1]